MTVASALFLVGALIALAGLGVYLWAVLGEEPVKPLAKYAGIAGLVFMVLGIFTAVGW